MLTNSNFDKVNVILKVEASDAKFSRIMLWIKNCTFQYNYCKDITSELYVPTIDISIPPINVKVFFVSCLFYKNRHELSLISAVVYALSLHWYFSSSYIQIKNCNFIESTGSLVYIYGKTGITRISIIGPFDITKNDGGGRNIISFYHVTVDIVDNATFSYNQHASNIILFYYCIVTFHKNISFIMNGPSINQAITLESDAPYITVVDGTNISFIDNGYCSQDIQVIVENFTPYPFCIFQYVTATSKMDYMVCYKITV